MKAVYKKTNRGFSMIEIVVYTALFVLISTSAFDLILRTYQAVAVAKLHKRVTTEGELATQRILREVRGAYAIDTSASLFGVHPSVLTVKTFAFPTGSATTSAAIRLNGNILEIAKGTTTIAITSSDVAVLNLIFRQVTTPNSQAVKIELRLTATTSAQTFASDFYTTAILRGSY